MTATLEKPAANTWDAPGRCDCASANYVTPEVNVVETPEAYVLEADLPGVNKQGLEVTIKKNELTIIGRRQQTAQAGNLLFRESRAADFRRVFELGENVDAGRVAGRIEQGLLTVTLPKAERAKPRKIEVA